MKKFDASALYHVAQQLVRCSAVIEHVGLTQQGLDLHETTQTAVAGILEQIAIHCRSLKLGVSTLIAEDLFKALSSDRKIRARDFPARLDAVSSAIRHELSLHFFYEIQEDQVKFYDGSLKMFRDGVASAFPSSQSEIEEAGRCLAVGRSTACVFHSMRAITPVLQTIAAELGFVEQRDWGKYLSAMKDKIWIKYPDNKTPENDAGREFYSDLEAQLRAYKEAWRNPTMHNPDKVYTEEKAEEIFGYVRGFMKKAAEKLKEHP
jgi:hypothetical protein